MISIQHIEKVQDYFDIYIRLVKHSFFSRNSAV